jgi:DNA-binding transcriptional regulator YiaG
MATKKAAKKATKKTATKKSSAKKSSRKYSPSAGKQVETEMHEMHQGKLKSGRSGKKVTNPKQAIAIGLSEARKKGAKVPPSPNK